MNSKVRCVRDYMTKTPITVDIDSPVTSAVRLMQQHNIRHLPVTRDDRVIGIVSERDIKSVLGLKKLDAESWTVRWVYSPVPFKVRPCTPLRKVVKEMKNQKYGSALVVERGRLLGIFTVTDALVALYEILSQGGKR